MIKICGIDIPFSEYKSGKGTWGWTREGQFRLWQFQNHIHEKFPVSVGSFGGTAVFFGDCGNRGKAGTQSAVSGGTVSGFVFLHISVKAVGGNHIKSVFMADLCGKAEVAGAWRKGPAPGDGVLQKVSEQCRHVQLRKRQGIRKCNVPVGFYACGRCRLLIIAEQGVQGRVFRVVNYGVSFEAVIRPAYRVL